MSISTIRARLQAATPGPRNVNLLITSDDLAALLRVAEAARTVIAERDDSAATVCEERLVEALDALAGMP